MVKRKWLLTGLGLSLAMLLSGGLLWALRTHETRVTVSGLGAPITFLTREKELGAALKANGISIGAKDSTTPALSTPLEGKEMTLEVHKAVAARVLVDGQTLQAETLAATVGDLLKELSVTLYSSDAVSVPIDLSVTPNLEVKVTRRSEQVAVEKVEIPFDTLRREDSNLDAGDEKEIEPGSPGVKEVKRVTRFEDGKEIGTEVVSEETIQPPTDRVVAYGTQQVVYRGTSRVRYSRQLEVVATGYTAGKESNPNGTGHTYTGIKATRGVIAVDPRVIPLHTQVYIDGYGQAVAEDIGGAIKGNRIDLCFDSLSEALQWGLRSTTVYILGD